MEKLLTFSFLIQFLISITNGQTVRDLFYQKPGWSNSPEKPQDCTFPCYDMSKKMLNFDIIVSLDEDCPKLEGNMEIKPFHQMTPCSNEEVKSILYWIAKRSRHKLRLHLGVGRCSEKCLIYYIKSANVICEGSLSIPLCYLLIFQGTKSCTYCLHKKQKSIVLKKSCLVDQHSKCDTHDDLSKIRCYNCTIFGPNVDDAEL